MTKRYTVKSMLMLLGGSEFWSVVDGETGNRVSDHLHEELAEMKADELNGKGPPGTVRIAVVKVRRSHTGQPAAEQVAQYLPQNYRVLGTLTKEAEASAFQDTEVLIGGTDNHGWTLDDYVIPRLGSGMLICTEIRLDLEHIQEGQG